MLVAEGDKEVEAEKRRLSEAVLEQERLERIAAAEHEQERDNDYQTEEESAWEGFESDYEGAEWLKKKRSERKTPAERNKVRRRKEAERQEKAERKEKERQKQTKQMGAIILKAKEEAKAKSLIKLKDSDKKFIEVDDRTLRRRKFGRDRFVHVPSADRHKLIHRSSLPVPSLDLKLPDEIQNSLRSLKPEGNLLKDRFRNMLVRGKLETRKPIQQPKKKRRTVTEKWTYKDFSIAL